MRRLPNVMPDSATLTSPKRLPQAIVGLRQYASSIFGPHHTGDGIVGSVHPVTHSSYGPDEL